MSAAFVYFLQSSAGGPIKIGSSQKPVSRLSTFNTWSPWPLELLAYVDGGSRQECYLHFRFAHLRGHGEWFHPTKELLTYIEEVKSLNALPYSPDDTAFQVSNWRQDVESRLREQLTAADVPVKDFAKQMGVTVATVNAWAGQFVPLLRAWETAKIFSERGHRIHPNDLWRLKVKAA